MEGDYQGASMKILKLFYKMNLRPLITNSDSKIAVVKTPEIIEEITQCK